MGVKRRTKGSKAKFTAMQRRRAAVHGAFVWDWQDELAVEFLKTRQLPTAINRFGLNRRGEDGLASAVQTDAARSSDVRTVIRIIPGGKNSWCHHCAGAACRPAVEGAAESVEPKRDGHFIQRTSKRRRGFGAD